MRRGAPLERQARLRARRATPRKSGRVHDEAHLGAVRGLSCYVCSRPGPSDADHQGQRPFGRKADDDTCVPMCRWCHRARTDGWLPDNLTVGGAAPTWHRAGKAEMRSWCDTAIAWTRAELARRRAPGGLPW